MVKKGKHSITVGEKVFGRFVKARDAAKKKDPEMNSDKFLDILLAKI